MPDLTELLKQREALAATRYGGVASYRDANGERVDYQDAASIARSLAALDSEIAALQRKRLSIVKIQSSKGIL
ncbi:phage head-tail joining protein [Paracoccus thiocyanatus]|nr:hypothetical protein [Paracoccus thiocyanatus]